ncbi:MAG TPA: MFS transporter [Actinomycetota bacterium]|nr:MFS transporter [Actinomycetota bacterium]
MSDEFPPPLPADDAEASQVPPGVPPEGARPGLLGRVRSLAIDLSPLRESRQYRLLITGETVSDLGSQITAVAIPFQVYKLTHSPLAVGLLALCEFFPILLLPLVGGAIADAVERRRLLRIVYGILPLLSLVLVWNARLASPHVWVLYVFATLSAAAYGLYSPAARSIPPLLFPKERLPSVFALQSAYYSFVALGGPAVAGVLIAVIGLPATYAVDVVSFLVALGTLSLMRPIPRVEEGAEVSLASIREGLRFLKGRRVLQSTFTVDLNAMIFGMPTALFPAFADHLGVGPSVLGLFYAAPYAGSLGISVLSGRARNVRRQGLAVELAVVVWGAAIAGFGLSRHVWLAVLMLAIAGAADMWSAIFRTSIGQTLTPDAMRGRMSGIELSVVASGPALGNLEAGVVGSLVSVPFSIVSGGLACVVGVGVISALVPQFRRYDASDPTP